jgi:hypothetical protein
MDKLIKTVIIILCISSFKSDKGCKEDLFLGIDITNSVKNLHKKLDRDLLFAPRPTTNGSITDSTLKSYHYRYIGPNLPIYNDYDSIVFDVGETVGSDGKEDGRGIKLKLMEVSIYYSDSNKLNNSYLYIRENRCKNLTFNTAVYYKYPIIELEKYSKIKNLYFPHPCYFLSVIYVDKL